MKISIVAGKVPIKGGSEAIVSPEDYDWLIKYKWHLDGNGYAVRAAKKSGKVKRYIMHREVNGTPKGYITDHINGNILDNRRENLRTCTNRENQYNTRLWRTNSSGYKGIHWHKNHQGWIVRVSTPDGRLFVGMYKALEDAVKAQREAIKKYHGEFANYAD